RAQVVKLTTVRPVLRAGSATSPLPVIQPLLAFAFSGPCVRRHRHSFPTRRSSDLSRIPCSAVTRAMSRKFACTGRTSRPAPVSRSEEHTSELQSRFDLVCRLLLEKKKDGHPTTPRLRHVRPWYEQPARAPPRRRAD